MRRGEAMTQVAVVEDDSRYRQSLETLLRHAPGFCLAGSFAAPLKAVQELESALRLGREAPWDLVLMDLELPGMSGIEAIRRLKAVAPGLSIVVLTAFEEPATVLDAICAGADGYLLKKTAAPDLLAQLAAVVTVGSPLPPRAARSGLGPP